MKKSKAALAEDAMIAAEIAKAHAFSAFLQNGPHERWKFLVEKGGAEGYAEARAAAVEFDRESRHGRRAMIYAINRLGSFPVDDDLARLAGLIGAK